MPQFDLLFFSLLNFLMFCVVFYATFLIFMYLFNSFFKLNSFSKVLDFQTSFILTIRNEALIFKAMRLLWIKKKILEYYDNE